MQKEKYSFVRNSISLMNDAAISDTIFIFHAQMKYYEDVADVTAPTEYIASYFFHLHSSSIFNQLISLNGIDV